MATSKTQSIATLSDVPRQILIGAAVDVASQSTSIFTTIYEEQALATARYIDSLREQGAPFLSPIAGMPISIKDLLDVAGEVTLAGSTVLADSAPAVQDAPVVARLRQSGAAIIGKTNMTEFAFSGIGINPHYGTPPNPCDATIARIPGGSSSGAAVSVATGLCIAAIGSDTGGSIRIPAALCGLVGFKPTTSRMNNAGCVPLSTTLDTICAITNSVADCMLMDRLIADSPLTHYRLPVSGLRLAVPQTMVLDDMDEQVAACFTKALSKLSAAGACIIETPMKRLMEYRSFAMFAATESYTWHRHLLSDRRDEYDPRVASRIMSGETISAADYIVMHAMRRTWIAAMEAEFAPYDAVLMPTVPIVAPPIADLETSDEAFFHANSLLLRNTATINLLDGCAISLPCHEGGRLPVGLSVCGVKNSDAHILAVAAAIEEIIR